MDNSGLSEQIRAAGRGDRAAASAVLQRLLPRIRNLVRYLLRGDDDVDDVTQQALIAIAKGLSSFRGDAPLERWADRITARETFRFLKRKRLTVAREAPLELAEPSAPPNDPYLLRRAVVTELDALPDAQRQVIVLHHAAGFTVPEIADLLEIPRDTVKSRIRLGMRRLRSAFADEVMS
ncbi:MAG: RNA polymerase sigma factor [Myxococcota bacterium]